MLQFYNDYDVEIDFGKHSGKKIKELPHEYCSWLLNNVKNKPYITNAIKRIRNRRGVTTLIKNLKGISFIPEMIEIQTKLKPIIRDPKLNTSLYGSFVEYAVKHYSGLSVDDEVQLLLAQYGLVEFPSHIVMYGELLEPTKRIKYIYNSFMKPTKERSISDICNLSFSHSIELGHFPEKQASDLFRWVNENQDYLLSYFTNLCIPLSNKEDQYTCDKISVGVVIGVIDMISGDAIVDIKCRQEDNVDEYRRQLFTYACLHHLRYGSNFTRCEVFNFLTGKYFVMALSDSCEKHAKDFIKSLGSYCPEHLELFK